MREIYIGNGQRIEVSENNGSGKTADLDKIKEIFSNNKEGIVYYGMKEDWFFTATQIKNSKDIENLNLIYSYWATPSICIKNGEDEEFIDCFHNVTDGIRKSCQTDGKNEIKFRLSLTLDNFVDEYLALTYEERREVSKQIKEIMEKYKEKKDE